MKNRTIEVKTLEVNESIKTAWEMRTEFGKTCKNYNLSSIMDYLIRQACLNESYASDIFYDLQTFDKAMQENDIDKLSEFYMNIGFRDCGVDSGKMYDCRKELGYSYREEYGLTLDITDRQLSYSSDVWSGTIELRRIK